MAVLYSALNCSSNWRKIPRRRIAVASGKGGVGKSTVAVNLALALAKLGGRVGLLDCDIYGPSVPLMMRAAAAPEVRDEKLVPVESLGIQLMSIGFLMDPDSPVIWRGPLIAQAVRQFIFDVAWGPLDWLVVDLPPGTGDAQLSLCQTVPLTGAVMVTTPRWRPVSTAHRIGGTSKLPFGLP